MDISEKVKEAETYRSMGLLEESILIYEEILSFEFALEDNTRNHFQSTVTQIREELASQKNFDHIVTSKDIAFIKDTLSLKNEIPQILENASAFMEMEQFRHALTEYEKLLVKENVWKDVLQKIVECILKCTEPSAISLKVKEMVARNGGSDQQKAEILFQFGLEMQNHNLLVVAHEFCVMAGELDPNSEEIIKWLKSNIVKHHHTTKQDHPGIHHKITTQQAKQERSDPIIEISIEFGEEAQIEKDSIDTISDEAVSLVDKAIISAFRKNVSDIHFEPHPESERLKILFRTNGSRYNFSEVPLSLARAIMTRIKILAHLDITEKQLPQSGCIKFKRDGIPDFKLRVQTIPITGGYEDAVLRIPTKAKALTLEEIGLTEKNLETLKGITSKPNGLFLVAGPAGSGKITTLHAILSHLNRPGIKIWTAEDPVKIVQPHLRQVEARPSIGLDFSRITRSFLRADPDVIMIGELTDEQTAVTALEGACAGHLVFSTLHTNDFAETISRLSDMHLDSNTIADALLGVFVQRLVKRLCPHCKTGGQPSKDEMEEIANIYGKDQLRSSIIKITPKIRIFQANGCDQCSDGYKGQVAIHEMVEITDEIKKRLKKQEFADSIAVTAANFGVTTLKQDAILKVFDGLIDLSEVRGLFVR